jgi:hypothetical protein
MTIEFNPPFEPDDAEVQLPMVYVKEDLTWEYKRLSRDLKEEDLLDGEELNELGAQGWELTCSVTAGRNVYFYFRRPMK